MRASPILALASAAPILAAAAPAQTFTPRIGFRNDHVLSGTPNAGEISPGTLDPLPLSVLFGAFDAQGFTNRGMFNFIGTVTVSDPLGEATLAYRTGAAGSGLRTPYNFGFVESIDAGGTQLYFDANRGSGQVNGVLWNWGDPPPSTTYTYPPFTSLGSGGGPDSYFPGERFWVNLDTFTPREITVTVAGTMQAITSWYVTDSYEPNDTEFPGYQDLLPAGFVEAQASATFVIHIIPAPGAAALLGLGVLCGTHRRHR